MRVVKAVAIAVAAVVLLVLALPVANWAYVKLASVDRDAYVRANERILNSLPVFPRARELARGSSGYHADNGDLGIDFTRGKAYVAIDASEIGMSGSDRKWKLGVSADHLGAVQP